MSTPTLATEWDVVQWMGSGAPKNLAALQSKVVVATAFQMLCPGCVEHSLPQLQRVHSLFSRNDVVVLDLHTVFEHHDAMGANGARCLHA